MSEINLPIHVMLVDDHHLFREGVSSLLKRDERFRVLGEASSGEKALAFLDAEPVPLPDIILMDVRMPGISGIEATRKILQKYPSVKVVMITASEKDADLFDAVKAGAQGYVLKAVTDSKQMREAILAVAAGEAIIPPAMVPRLLNEFAAIADGKKADEAAAPPATPVDVSLAAEPEETVAPEDDAINLLTPREREVLELVAEGLTNKEIAVRLTISVNTVRSHLRFILDKLHINNRVQAAIWYQSKQ